MEAFVLRRSASARHRRDRVLYPQENGRVALVGGDTHAPRVVETQRLHLRPFAAGDVTAVTFYADPDVMRFIPRGAWKAAELPTIFAAMVERREKQWADRGFGMWAVVFKESGSVIGHCGLQPLDDSGEIEVFYLLDKPYWGRGIAAEAAIASISFGFEHAGLTKIVAVAMKENAPSQRVMQKAGMLFVGPAHQYGLELVKYEIARAETGVLRLNQPA